MELPNKPVNLPGRLTSYERPPPRQFLAHSRGERDSSNLASTGNFSPDTLEAVPAGYGRVRWAARAE
jgi:hypothetical protein